MGRDAVFSREVFLPIDTPWGISSWRTKCCRCVVGRDAVFHQGKYFLNRHALGHPLREDAVLWDVCCVLMGMYFFVKIDTPWGISSWQDAVLWDVRCVLKGSIFE